MMKKELQRVESSGKAFASAGKKKHGMVNKRFQFQILQEPKGKSKKKKMLKFDEPQCTNPSCFFCSMKETNPFRRRSKLTTIFKEIPRTESKDHVLVLSGLWNIAMSEPGDPEFPSLGLFECMSKLIHKSIKNSAWLLKDQNIFIPYYAAHIIGSYVMNKEDLAARAVYSKAFVVPALLELLRGNISWVEQRASARALGHLASHEKSFEVVSLFEEETVKLSMEIATSYLVDMIKYWFLLF